MSEHPAGLVVSGPKCSGRPRLGMGSGPMQHNIGRPPADQPKGFSYPAPFLQNFLFDFETGKNCIPISAASTLLAGGACPFGFCVPSTFPSASLRAGSVPPKPGESRAGQHREKDQKE